MTSGDRTRRQPWLQFSLSSLLLAKTACALAVAAMFAILPQFVDNVRIASGQLMIHLTPAGQQLFFDPPAPMGPMHETKVFLLSSLGYDAATLLAAIGFVGCCVRIIPRVRLGRRSRRVWPPAGTAFAGLFIGALIGGAGIAVLLRTGNCIPHATIVGGAVGALSGAFLAKRGIEPACFVAGLAAFLCGTLGTMAIVSFARVFIG